MNQSLAPIFHALLGVNTVDDPKSERFQSGDSSAFLRHAENVDVDRTGGYRRRQGRTKRLALTDAHSAFAIGGRILLVDDGALQWVDPHGLTTQPLVTGLGTHEVSYAALGGEVYWSNGSQCGRVSGDEATFWGLTPCGPPTLALTTGSLRAGRYLVATTVTVNGIESGSRGATAIDVPDQGGILVTPTDVDPWAEALQLYCSDPDHSDLFWVKEGSALIDQVGVSTDLLDGLGASPPPPGQLVRAFNGRLLVASGATLYWSEPLAPHRFRLDTDFQMFTAPIVLLEPMPDGFYVAVEQGPTWWVGGDDPANWRPREISARPVCGGSALRLPGNKLPWAQTTEIVAIWGTADGWACGLPGGVVQYPTEGRLAMDPSAKATLAYREEDGLRQILMSLREQTGASRLGASDRTSATIIKADGTIQ